MGNPTKDYDPKEVGIYINGVALDGFADGTFLSVSRNNQTWTVVSGASGEHARARSNDRTGTVEVTLMQSSASNDFLNTFLMLDDDNFKLGQQNGKFALSIRDKNGFTVVGTTEAWIQQPPALEFGKELGDRVWTFESGDLKIVTGGIGTEVLPS